MLAPVLSLAATGLSAAGSIVGAQGQAKADEFQAQQAEDAYQYGQLAAAQTGMTMTQNMQRMLGHISAVRASLGSDPRSPTTAAVMANQEGIAEREQAIRVGNIEAQAKSDQQASQMYTSLAGTALEGGYLGAAGSFAKGLAGAFGSSGGGIQSMFNFSGTS